MIIARWIRPRLLLPIVDQDDIRQLDELSDKWNGRWDHITCAAPGQEQHGLMVVQAGRKKGGRGKGSSGRGKGTQKTTRGKGGRGKGAQATNGGGGFCFTFSNHGHCSNGSSCRYFANTPGHNQESGKSHVSNFVIVPACMASALTWPHVSAAHACTGHHGKGKY